MEISKFQNSECIIFHSKNNLFQKNVWCTLVIALLMIVYTYALYIKLKGRRKVDNWVGHIHIFVCTDCKNNRFQKKLIVQNTSIRICHPPPPQLSIFPTSYPGHFTSYVGENGPGLGWSHDTLNFGKFIMITYNWGN